MAGCQPVAGKGIEQGIKMKYCIIDTSDKRITKQMQLLGYKCISIIASDCVSPSICRHADVLYKKLNQNTIIASACQKANFALLEKLGYRIIVNDKLKPGYKTESYLNYIYNDDYIIYNPKTAQKPPFEFLINKQEITVKQGYTGCSTIIVTEKAYITDDEGIYKTLTNNYIDCLLIPKGDIKLEGYDYGFIGGASVKLNKNEIQFFGDFTDKKAKHNVVEFLSKYNITAQFIENMKLTDIGSAIIL